MSFKGAEVIAPEALPYKSEEMEVTVVHYQRDNIYRAGTSIEGEFDRIIQSDDKKFSCLTVAGREIRLESGILSQLSNALSNEG
ncbi:MAG: aspartate kinase, partial [Candidatus Nanohaloarchaea archaeon]